MPSRAEVSTVAHGAVGPTSASTSAVVIRSARSHLLSWSTQGTSGHVRTLMGRPHPVMISGTIERPDTAALARLGLTGTILIVKATFSIVIAETALAANATAFDGDVIPIAVSLVLRHIGG